MLLEREVSDECENNYEVANSCNPWAMILALFLIVLVVARIRNEEAVLLRDLKGYREYTEKVRSRLVPGV